MAIVTSSSHRASRLTSAVMAAAAHRRRTAKEPQPVLHIPADQIPPKALARLRHPSTPPTGYLVRWDPITMTTVWQPCAVQP